MEGEFGAEEVKRKQMATLMVFLELLLEQEADTERECDPLLQILRALKADPDVLDLVELYSRSNYNSRMGGMASNTLSSTVFRRTRLVEGWSH